MTTSLEAAKPPVRSILETHYGFDHVMADALSEEERDAVVTTIAAAAIRAYLENENTTLPIHHRDIAVGTYIPHRLHQLKDTGQ